MSSLLRTAKYSVKGYNSVQAKVRDATSNDPQPPTGAQLNELSQLSYNPDYFQEIAIVLGKRLDDKGRNWRHVYKSLVVLDYLLHSGSEAVVLYFQKNVYVVKTLKEFQYVDEEGKDQGANIRIKATDIANLLIDDTRLRQIRRNRAEMRDRMLGRLPRQDSLMVDEDLENENVQRRSMLLVPNEGDEDAVRLQSARAQIRQARAMEDRDLMKAFKMNQDDENKRANAVQQAALPGPLFEEPASMSTATTPTATTPTVTTPIPPQSSEPAPLVVFDGMDQMTPQPPPQIMPQYTSFNPFFNMQAQQDMFQAEQLRQQQEWLKIQAAQQQLQQQQEEWLRQQILQQQQQQALHQQQPFFQISTEPSLFQTQAAPFQPQPQAPTPVVRSNNPFAPAASPSFSFASSQMSSLPSPTSSSPSPVLLTPSSPEPPANVLTSTQPSPMRKNSPFNTQHLDHIFANRDDAGMDTFGNVGQLRYGHNFTVSSA